MQVDVVTAAHESHAVFLPATWQSLLRQSHTRWRWLVQIDGPPSAVQAALVGCGAAADPRVAISSHGTTEGPAVTRNVALGRATAPLVQNVDADDELEADALTALGAALAEHPTAGYAVGHARDLMANGVLIEHLLPLPPGILPRGVLLSSWKTSPTEYLVPVHPAGTMWRRHLLIALGGWSALHGMEDTGLLMAASALAEGILIDTPTLRYRRHPAQRSKRTSKFTGGGNR
ncbi:glycosyltransferase [Streptomyces sp. NPDC127068]|uniref:glycosyltransferase n=1 Tax=Streptomyces sp. NPDC127068 TaxID=3347127 RepID=UPI003668DB98